LADALRSAGRDSDAVQVETSLMARGRDADPRTFALFLATRRTAVAEAIRVAERELDTRRDIFTLDAVAWTLAAGGRLAEAGDAMSRALSEGTQDGRLFLHAAAIAERQGRRDEARAWSARADAFRTTLLPSERAELERVRQRVAGTTN
jgi:hypothetical protein